MKSFRGALRLCVLAVLLLAACDTDRQSRDARPQPTGAPVVVEATPASTPEPAAATQVPRFEREACPFKPARGNEEGKTVVCGYVVVPEEHANPGGKTIRLATAVFKAARTGADPSPLFWLDGGPGGYALDNIGVQLSPAVVRVIAPDRDMVVFDQRGAGYSRPALACPELTDLKYATLNRRLSRADEATLSVQAAAACHDRLVGEGVHPAAYTSAENAADVNDIRAALGYDRINLYGVSYGTRLALTVMRDFPAVLRGVVLDSTVPVQANLYPEIFTSAQHAFDQLFRGCAASVACNAAYPGLEATFYALVARLNAEPMRMTITNNKTGKEYEYLLTGDRLVAVTFQMLYQSPIIPSLPRIILALHDGDPEPFEENYRDVLFFDLISDGMYLSVQCGEEARFTSEAQVHAAARAVRPELGENAGDGFADDWFFPTCALWGARPAAPVENEPVRSDVPTLILAGEYDPITPPSYAEEAAATLSNSHVFVYPGLGHGPGLSHPCPLTMLSAFIKDPSRAPDAACISTMPGPAWVVRR